MLLTEAAIVDAAAVVDADDFYRPAHRHVCAAIVDLFAASVGVDTVTVAARLGEQGLLDAVGGAAELVDMQASTPVAGNAAHYAGIIVRKARLRRALGAALEIAEIAWANPVDVDGALDDMSGRLFGALDGGRENAPVHVNVGVEEHRADMAAGGDAGLDTGFVDLDDLLGGLRSKTLVVIGGRPGMGKSALGAQIAAHVAATRPVLLCSLEMQRMLIARRLISGRAQVPGQHLEHRLVEGAAERRLTAAEDDVAALKLWIVDSASLSPAQLLGHARRLVLQQGPLALIVVDYLQLMATRRSAENRQVEVAEVARALKVLADEMECPIIAVAQLSRAPEQRTDKRPLMADLRESGAIEQDADVIMFLYRDEVYHAGTVDGGVAEVSVAKHRGGPTGTVRLAWRGELTRFDGLTRRAP